MTVLFTVDVVIQLRTGEGKEGGVEASRSTLDHGEFGWGRI